MNIIILVIDLAFIVAVWVWLRRLETYVAHLTAPPRPQGQDVGRQSTLEVVFLACQALGLPREELTAQFDLAGTGKIYDVLRFAAIRSGKDHELRTVGDVAAWLDAAPSVLGNQR